MHYGNQHLYNKLRLIMAKEVIEWIYLRVVNASFAWS